MFVQMMIAGEWLAAAFNLNSKEGITTSPPDNAAYSVAKAAVKVLTKLLEQAVDRLSHLPDDRQDELAKMLLRAVDDDDFPIPQWQRDILDERLADAERNPDDFVTLDELEREVRDRRRL